METKEKIMNIEQDGGTAWVWYRNKFVQFELAKQLQHKYLSIRKPIGTDKKGNPKYTVVRYLLGYTPDLIVKSCMKFGGFNFGWKYYFDLAYWKDMPMFSFNADTRKIQKNDFDNNWENHYVGYDFAIDIDSKTLSKAHEDAAIIKKFFDHNKIPYYIQFSGSKGFHFVVPFEYLPKTYSASNLPRKCADLAEWIVNRFNLQKIDESIYDHRRILKLAYSLDKDKVCLPLDDQQFDNFDVEEMKIKNVMKHVRIFKRGVLLRKHGLTETELKKNVRKLFKLELTESGE